MDDISCDNSGNIIQLYTNCIPMDDIILQHILYNWLYTGYIPMVFYDSCDKFLKPSSCETTRDRDSAFLPRCRTLRADASEFVPKAVQFQLQMNIFC